MRRALRVLFVGVPLSLMFLVLFEQPASAQAGCVATLNGSPSTNFNTPKRALRVRHDQRLAVSGTVPNYNPSDLNQAAVVSYLVNIELAGATWTATSGVSDGSTWSGTVNVADYATRGQGIYKVVAVTRQRLSDNCFARAYVKVQGDGGALSTTAGQVAAGLGGAALLGAGAAAGRGGKNIDEGAVKDAVGDFLEDQGREPETTEEADRKKAMEEMQRRHQHEVHLMELCLPLVVVAAAATLKAVASDVGRHVVAAIGGWMR